MAKLHENPNWGIDPAAQELHQKGLDLETEIHDYEAAHEAFHAGTFRLRSLEQTPEVVLQMARVWRDDGFTSVREKDWQTAGGSLFSSLDLTRKLLKQYPKDPALYAEHGATMSALGRMVVSRQAEIDKPDVFTQHWFGGAEAHGHLKRGNNDYYLVSNAMQAARAERFNRRLMHVTPWLGRAAVGLVKSVISDRRNLLPSLKTAGRLGISLRSRQAAVASILRHP